MVAWLACSMLVILLDQLTKNYMTALLPLCEAGNCASIDILPVFRLVLLHNQGAAFSFLSDAGGWQRWFLVFISAAVSVVLAIWIIRLKSNERFLAIGLSLILGGAVGNLIDRASQGYVVDFLLVHYREAYFPAFNVADSAITVGAALMIIDMIFFQGRRAVNQKSGETP